MKNREIGIIGDFRNSITQSAIADSIEHSNRTLGITNTYRWIDTTTLDTDDYAEILQPISGIWSATGCPFKSINGSLNAIRYARENGIPHLGTCSGFQHTIIEYARNVLGYRNAQHAEYTNDTTDLFIDRLACSLKGTRGEVKITEHTLAREIYGIGTIEVDYYCSYGINEVYRPLILSGDLIVSGMDVNRAIRMMELKGHPFFIITAFVPQMESSFDKPNPLITEFIRKVNETRDHS